MQFASDNTSGVHPKIMTALSAANAGYAPAYGADRDTEALTEQLRDLFSAPDALVYPMVSGTGTNAALLAAMSPPWGVIYCHEAAHIEVDERGAVPFYAHGAKLRALPSCDSRLDLKTLKTAVATDRASGADAHGMPPAAVSVTNLTEFGAAYSPENMAQIAQDTGLPLHMDGARFGNALAATGTRASDFTPSLTSLSLGATKLGAMAAEAAVVFDPQLEAAVMSHRMRGGHNLSKARYISAQMLAWLKDDLWLSLAAHANGMGARLSDGLTAKGLPLAYAAEGNMVFAYMPDTRIAAAKSAGAAFHTWPTPTDQCAPEGSTLCRFVCSWSTREADVDQLLGVL